MKFKPCPQRVSSGSILHLAALALAVFTLTACAENTYNRIETGGTARTDARLDSSLPVLITNVKDAVNNGRTVASSGTVVTRTIDASLSRYAGLVDVSSTEYQKPGTAQGSNAYAKYAYIVVPTITTWEVQDAHHDRYPTQIKIRLTVVDASTNEKISSDYLEATAPMPYSLSSFVNYESEDPADMLSELVDDYIDELYGHPSIF